MKKTLIALTLAALTPVVMAAGNAEAGKAKSAVCAGCHGANGKAMVPTYPNLAGQNAAYLELAIKDYKNKTRTGPNAALMYGMVGNLSDQDIADLAAYFAAMKP